MKSLLANHINLERTRSFFVRNSNNGFSHSLNESIESIRQTDQLKNKMQLPIARDIIIKDLEKQFQDTYTYLNLRFVKDHQHSTFTSAVKKLCNSSKSLGQELKLKQEGVINITDTTTVAELIKEFQEIYGIPVQLCRKSGNLWIEVTLTLNWTLQQQNDHGKEISIQ